MSYDKVVTVVMYRRSDGTLELYGIFESMSDARKSIVENSTVNEVFFVEGDTYDHLIDNLIADQGWKIILTSADTDSRLSMDDVWGYCITDTIR